MFPDADWMTNRPNISINEGDLTGGKKTSPFSYLETSLTNTYHISEHDYINPIAEVAPAALTLWSHDETAHRKRCPRSMHRLPTAIPNAERQQTYIFPP